MCKSFSANRPAACAFTATFDDKHKQIATDNNNLTLFIIHPPYYNKFSVYINYILYITVMSILCVYEHTKTSSI